MPERIFDTLRVDGDDSKLDASLIVNINNNEDFSALRHDVSASHIIQTATGNPAYFDDGADSVLMKSVTIAITPVQGGGGVPSPDNIRPISGREVATLYHSDIDTSDPTEYSVDLSEAETVYGGSLEVISGTLTVTHGYIESYSGEELPGAWISDRDVYTEGTLPSFGAQVVYELVTPNQYTLPAQTIKSFAGVNNVWSNAGNVTCEYCVDVNGYIASEKADYDERLDALGTSIEEVRTDLDEDTTRLSITKVIGTEYMTDTQFRRIVAWKKRNMLFLLFNAEFTSAGLNATSGFVTIANISGWSALSELFISIPKQTDGSRVMTLFVRSNGEVQVHSPQAAISGWFRGCACVPYNGQEGIVP